MGCTRRPPLAKRRPMTAMPLDKTFDPAAIEAKWYAHWEANGLFRPERPDAEPFTMSPEFTRAVTKVFVDLYNERLIYRDKRLVNWDPKLKTAISDLEVETREIKGSFWHFRYPLADGVKLDSGADHIVVATTR